MIKTKNGDNLNKKKERKKIKIDSLWLLFFEVVFGKCTFNIKTMIKLITCFVALPLKIASLQLSSSFKEIVFKCFNSENLFL